MGADETIRQKVFNEILFDFEGCPITTTEEISRASIPYPEKPPPEKHYRYNTMTRLLALSGGCILIPVLFYSFSDDAEAARNFAIATSLSSIVLTVLLIRLFILDKKEPITLTCQGIRLGDRPLMPWSEVNGTYLVNIATRYGVRRAPPKLFLLISLNNGVYYDHDILGLGDMSDLCTSIEEYKKEYSRVTSSIPHTH
jgi:hypothetical protein